MAAQTPASSDSSPADLVASCKRRISELEGQIEQINSQRTKRKPNDSFLVAGRCIRRLVSLTDRVEDLVTEADRRMCLEDGLESPSAEDFEADRLYGNYKELLRWQPGLVRMLSAETSYQLSDVYKELNKGADSARGDDAASLKRAVIHWLVNANPEAARGLELDEKTGRGFDHEVTGRLLCPVDYTWTNDQHRTAIRSFHPDYLATADSWPMFLYEGERYDPQDPTKGLFKNALLLKAFKHVFTSPSSALKTDIGHEQVHQLRRSQKLDERRTRSHIASLLGMKSVSCRAIAYIAVQLRFALSSCGSWRIIDGEFRYDEFYYNIISFFEDAETPEDKKFIEDLLLWWNIKVFGRTNMSTYRPRNKDKLSVALSHSARGRGHAGILLST